MRVPAPDEIQRRIAEVAPVAAVLERLGKSSVPPTYLVGGAVRDLLLGNRPLDVDLVVEGPLEPVLERLGGAVRRHDRFGTATVELDGFVCDLSRSRRERYAEPGALPGVEPAPLAEDLLRRDFTVNAIAVGLSGGGPGDVVAAPHALEDLTARSLRVLHPASFRDDPTRLLRLARYRSRLGFAVEPVTAGWAHAAVAGAALGTVNGSRVGHELRLMAAQDEPIAAIAGLRELGVDEAIEPGFGLSPAEVELARAAAALLGGEDGAAALVFGVALRRVAPERRRELLTRLAFPAGEREVILEVAGQADPLAARLTRAQRPSELAAAATGAALETVAMAGALGPAGPAREWLERLRHARLAIDGDDLIAAGIIPGPAVGAGLRAARAALLDGRAPDRERQLSEALRGARGTG
jgi:tRNA nucleotidyltransferase (CCA-adding enzyme)